MSGLCLCQTSHSWNLALQRLGYPSQSIQLSEYHSQTLLCRPPRQEFLMTLPPRRRTSLVPRYPLTLLSRRVPAVRVFLDAAVQTPSYSLLSPGRFYAVWLSHSIFVLG